MARLGCLFIQRKMKNWSHTAGFKLPAFSAVTANLDTRLLSNYKLRRHTWTESLPNLTRFEPVVREILEDLLFSIKIVAWGSFFISSFHLVWLFNAWILCAQMVWTCEIPFPSSYPGWLNLTNLSFRRKLNLCCHKINTLFQRFSRKTRQVINFFGCSIFSSI